MATLMGQKETAMFISCLAEFIKHAIGKPSIIREENFFNV
jgi:hypothetical protein